jgi:hypothetical protein
VSSFAFVEAMGPVYVGKLLRDGLGFSPMPVPNDPTPRFDPELDLETRIAAAETVLRAMSLTDGFARIVLLVGPRRERGQQPACERPALRRLRRLFGGGEFAPAGAAAER